MRNCCSSIHQLNYLCCSTVPLEGRDVGTIKIHVSPEPGNLVIVYGYLTGCQDYRLLLGPVGSEVFASRLNKTRYHPLWFFLCSLAYFFRLYYHRRYGRRSSQLPPCQEKIESLYSSCLSHRPPKPCIAHSKLNTKSLMDWRTHLTWEFRTVSRRVSIDSR